MEKKALALALLAIAAGTALLQWYMHNFEQAVAGGAKVSVLIATRDAKAGEIIQRDMLGLRDLPEDYLESRHVRAEDLGEVIGQRLGTSTKANETLLWSDVASLGVRVRTLAMLVQDGMRAVAVRAQQGNFGDMLRPGDRVDILLVRTAPSSDDPGAVKTLLQNVLVLATGDAVLQPGENTANHASRSNDVTVSLTSEQARTLAYAETLGSLRLLLRNPSDVLIESTVKPEQPVTPGTLHGTLTASHKPAAL